MKNNYSYFFIAFSLLTACNFGIEKYENDFEGNLTSSYVLVKSGEKSFPLDSVTGQKNNYSQLFNNSDGIRIFSFLNNSTKTIYFYNYETCKFIKTLSILNSDSSLFKYTAAYFIVSEDSIYFHDNLNQKIFLLDNNQKVKESISLIGFMNPKTIEWTLKFPLYNPTASSAMLFSKQGLIYTGQYMWTIPDSLINNFKFTSIIDFENKKLSHISTYPKDFYGGGKWDDPLYSAIYSDLDFDNNQLVYSFPITHNVYTVDLYTGKHKTFYAGSNFAKSISTINKKQKGDLTYREKLKNHIVKTDLYAGIKYDKYNKLYYRFIRKGIINAKPADDLLDKDLAVIIFDKDFNYLGENVIGESKKWNWENSFVTKEGLNIEFIEQSNNDETQLMFKIFKAIKK
jgi:hypothetical protein